MSSISNLSKTTTVLSMILFSAAAATAQTPCNTGKAGGAGCGALASPLNAVTGGATRDGNWDIAYPYPSYNLSTSLGSMAPCSLTYEKGWVDTPNVLWNLWLAENSFSASQWVETKKEDQAGGYYIYRTKFKIPAGETSVKLTGQLSSDNQTVELLLNDPPASNCRVVYGTVNPAGPGTSDYQQWWNFGFTAPVTASTDAYVYAIVENYGAPATPTGFRLEFNSIAYARSSGVGTGTLNGFTGIAVANAGTNTVSVILGGPNGTLTQGGSYPVGTTPIFVAVGDLNGDGIADLAVVNSGATATAGAVAGGSISILFGNGDGTYKAGQTYPVGTSPSSLAIADLNGDGIPDLAIADAGSNNVYVMLGAGQGQFKLLPAFPVGKAGVSSLSSIAIADLNGDGRPDVAVTDAGTGELDVLLNAGNGEYKTVSYVVGKAPSTVIDSLVIGDFNHDGVLDLAVASAGSNTVVVLLGTTTGTFGKPVSYPAGPTPSSLIAGDFNGDGSLDLAVANPSADTVTVLIGTGKGSFLQPVTYQTGTTPESLATADLNGDGILDLTTANAGSNDVSVLLGTGTGTFGPPTEQ